MELLNERTSSLQTRLKHLYLLIYQYFSIYPNKYSNMLALSSVRYQIHQHRLRFSLLHRLPSRLKNGSYIDEAKIQIKEFPYVAFSFILLTRDYCLSTCIDATCNSLKGNAQSFYYICMLPDYKIRVLLCFGGGNE